MKTTKIEYACNHCGKKPSWKEDTGISKKLLEGSIHGYVAWQETDKTTGVETYKCLPHGESSGDWVSVYTKSFSSIEELGRYIGQNKLKTY